MCVATSAHQIEGNNINSDWWDWEQQPGKIKNNEISGKATNHWELQEQDLNLLAELGIQQYRFSIEWAKIEPFEGQYDSKAIEWYRKLILGLLERGIKPMVTLHHFTFPKWVRIKGGWQWEGISTAFSSFSELVFTQIAPEAQDWITINEPMVHLVTGYLAAAVPPGIADIKAIQEPLIGLIKSHAASYHRLHRLAKQKGKDIRVGLAHHLREFDHKYPINLIDQLAAYNIDHAFNWALPMTLLTGVLDVHIPFTLKIKIEIQEAKNTQDFFGLNYYTRDFVHFTGKKPIGIELSVKPNIVTNDMGWEIYPKGLYKALSKIHKHFKNMPIIITENGLADANDSKRIQFITTHLTEMKKALKKGVNIQGYCYWSLLDNFEWIEGFGPRFGLIEVNYTTYERKWRPSAFFYRKLIQNQ